MSMPSHIQDVYAELGQVLNRPETFGLGRHVPQPLADRLESMRRMLKQALREQESLSADVDLAAELSQDADRDALSTRRAYWP